MLKAKQLPIKKIITILMNIIRSWAFPIGQLLLAKQVIQNQAGLWGETVGILIYLQLFNLISTWGNNEYVLREASLKPMTLNKVWNLSFYSRLVLLLAAILIANLLFPIHLIAAVTLWLCGQYISSSVEGLILFHNKIKEIAWVELILLILVSSFLLLKTELLNSVFNVLWVITVWQLLRAFGRIIILSKKISLKFPDFSIRYFYKAGVFMLIAVSSTLFSKIDLYVANAYLDDVLLGKYQLFISCFIYLQSIAGLMMMPFIKQLYRFTLAKMKKIVFMFSGIGIAFTALMVPIVRIFLMNFYQIEFEIINYIIESFIVIALFFSLPIIVYLKGQKKENHVLYVGTTGALINFMGSLLLYPYYGFTGFIIATAGSQVIGGIIYYILLNKRRQVKIDL